MSRNLRLPISSWRNRRLKSVDDSPLPALIGLKSIHIDEESSVFFDKSKEEDEHPKYYSNNIHSLCNRVRYKNKEI